MRASRLKRSAARAVRPSSGGSTLSATTRRSPTSVALNTTAIPPRASSCSTSYSPASTIRSRCRRSSPLSDGTMSVASCGSPTSVPQCPQNRAGGGHPHRTGSTSRQDLEGLGQGGHAVGEDGALDLNDEGRRAVPFRPERVLPRGKLEDAGVRRRRAQAGGRELVAPGLDHNAERHRAIAAEDRVADVGDGNGLWPGGAEDVREPARQPPRPNHHRQREPYRLASGSHQERLPASAGDI